MTLHEIELRLAELLEPKEGLPEVDEETTPFPEISPKRAWVTDSIHKYDQHWTPRPRDGAYAIELLKTFHVGIVFVRLSVGQEMWRSVCAGEGLNGVVYASTPENAIALAVIAKLEAKEILET